jgi:hypothetical protein
VGKFTAVVVVGIYWWRGVPVAGTWRVGGRGCGIWVECC